MQNWLDRPGRLITTMMRKRRMFPQLFSGRRILIVIIHGLSGPDTPRYAFLFKLDPEDYEGWAYGLKKAGYATNIRYPQILIKLIQDYDLEKYSLIALGKLPPETVTEESLTKQIQRESIQGFIDSSVQKRPDASYPESPFSINAARCVYAKSGSSLLYLSNLYDIPLAKLLEFNDMKQEDILSADQLIFLQRKRKLGSTTIHIVLQGESVYSICQTEGVRYESLLEYNLLRPGEEPAAGEKIYLQSACSAKPALKNSGSAKTGLPSS